VRHEEAHKTYLKDSGNPSLHNLNYLPQVITFKHRILYFKIREFNHQALTQHRENSAAACKLLPSGANLAAPVSPQIYNKPEFMGHQNYRDGKHPDTLIKESTALLDNTQDAMHRVAIYSGTREVIMCKSLIMTSISNEQLHAMELCSYHGIKVQVQGLDGECISKMFRFTGSQSWRGGDRRNDWVWVKPRPGRCFGLLNWHLPWQPQRLFKIKLLHEDGAFVEYWLALALTTIPGNSVNSDPVLRLVQVRKAPAAVALQVLSVGNIVSCAHISWEMATRSKTGDGRNERWIVDSHMDLVTKNDVYNW